MRYLLFILLVLFPSLATAEDTIVIFGSTGDLSSRKLLPAFYNLAKEGALDENYSIIGIGRRPLSQEEVKKSIYSSLEKFSRSKPTQTTWSSFEQHFYYHQADFLNDEGYDSLKTLLDGKNNILFYLATDSQYSPHIVQKLHLYQLIKPTTKIIVEKPFGQDLESSIALQDFLSQFLKEDQIYRIDHYLGKTGVYKLSDLRFKDGHFEWLLHKNFVKNIQITLSETIGIGTRANFYENTGHLRDVIQSHAMQLAALALMEPPSSLDADHVHQVKERLLNDFEPIPIDNIDNYVVRGQYGPGWIEQVAVPGYRQEKGVSESSQVETFVQAKLFINNDRWKGVPIYMRSGKRLAEQTTQITFNLRDNLFGIDALTISIQPEIQVYLTTGNEIIKYQLDAETTRPDREAYENLILAALKGDHSDFVTMEEVNSTWRLFEPIIRYWKSNTSNYDLIYEAGSWGPAHADSLLKEDGIVEWKVISNKK